MSRTAELLAWTFTTRSGNAAAVAAGLVLWAVAPVMWAAVTVGAIVVERCSGDA